MKSGFAEQLELSNVVKTVELVDESGVGAGGHAAAAVLVFVDEGHPQPVVVPPFHLVLGRPVKPVRPVGLPVGSVKFPKRGERVLVVPLGAARAHLVAAGFVDRESGHQSEVQLDQLVHHRVPAFAERRCGLLPEPAGLAEAVLFVVVVVVERKVLDRAVREERLGQTVPMLESGQAQTGSIECVHPGDTHLRKMGCSTDAAPPGLVDRCLHDVRAVRAELQTVGAFSGHFRHPRASLLRSCYRFLASLAEPDVSLDARGRDIILFAFGLVLERPIEPVHASRVAHRRDAVTHPELQHILGRRALRGAPRVAVHVDQAGKHVHSGKIEDLVTGIGLGPIPLFYRHSREADALDLRDPVPLDHDVHGTGRRGACAVDQVDAAENQALKGSLPFSSRRRLGNGLRLILRENLEGSEPESKGERKV